MKNKLITLTRRAILPVLSRLSWYRSRFKGALYNGNELRLYAMTCPYPEIRKKIWIRMGFDVGDKSYINNMINILPSVYPGDKIVLGDRVALSPGTVFILQSSPNDSILKSKESAQSLIRHGSIVIGDDTWIGANCVIHPGIRIGRCCVIGAMSNVTKDIPDFSVAYGNPASIRKVLNQDDYPRET